MICEKPGILKTRNTPIHLKELHDQGLLATLSNKYDLIGIAALWPTSDENWLELGSTLIVENYQGKGFLRALYFGVIETLRHKEKKGFLITNNPMIINIASKSVENFGLGWEKYPLQWLEKVYEINTGDKELDENNKMLLQNRIDVGEYKNSLLFVQPEYY
jgi:hypothetical protein